MASRSAAEEARRLHSDDLLALGAHAVAVDRFQSKKKRTFGVIAFFEKKPEKVPLTLDVTIDGKLVRVPVAVRVAPPFTVETIKSTKRIH